MQPLFIDVALLRFFFIFLLLLTFSFLTSFSALCAEREKFGVLFLSVGEDENYKHDWVSQFFNNMFDLFEPGFFAGGPFEGGTCYSGIHIASAGEAYICGVPEGTLIDVFCQPYTGAYPLHDLQEHDPPPVGDDGFMQNCYPNPDDAFPPTVWYPLYFGMAHVDDPAGRGIGIADFTEVVSFSRMDKYYRLPDHKNYNRKQLLKWWYGNDAPGYTPDTPELTNVKDTLTALYPQYEFIFRHGWEGYMENEDPYGNPSNIPGSTENVIEELIAAGAQHIIVATAYAAFSNLTQFGHEWYDSNGQPISALSGKTFKQCVEDLTDGKGPKTQQDIDTYLADKAWNKHWKHPFPLIEHLVHNTNPAMDLRFANPYGNYQEFEQAVVDALNYTIGKYSIPQTASLKVILALHGYYRFYKDAQECDSYFRLTDDLGNRVVSRVQNNFTWPGRFEVVYAPADYAEPTEDPASTGKPFGDIMSVGEHIDTAINGKYVNELGTIINNGDNNFKYVIVIPFYFDSESSDTVYGMRELILGNAKYDPACACYVRNTTDKDGTKYDAGDVDPEYFTVKSYDATGWVAKQTPKGSTTNPTTLILSGAILSLNSGTGYGQNAREGLTNAFVRAIGDSMLTITTTTTTIQQPTTTTTSIQPTLVTLTDFQAVPGDRSVTLQWKTASEINNAGFNLYRSEVPDGAYKKITNALIPAQGSPAQGASYEFVDKKVQNRKTYYYKLEDIEHNGKSTFHGPVSATPRWIWGLWK